jgi:N-acyl-D-aspartate/D-glutamate deacylase
MRRCAGFIICALLVVAGAVAGAQAPTAGTEATGTEATDAEAVRSVDIVIRNGTVVDGRGTPGVRADVAIDQGRIAAVGSTAGFTGKHEIDAEGRVVCPGFIDLHSHADGGIATHRAAENYLRQGVTTLVCGNCGMGPVDVCKFFADLRGSDKDSASGGIGVASGGTGNASGGTGPNVALLIGHGAVRRAAVGPLNVPATAEQLETMKRLVREAMEAGAVGLSTGLTYSPSAYGSTDEIIALTRELAPYGGFYATHIRDEGVRVFEAIDEALKIGREAGVPVHISHHKISAVTVWGLTRLTLEKIDAARAAGQDVTLDQYPYAAGSGSLQFYVPQDSLSGGIEAYRDRIAAPKTRPQIVDAVEKVFRDKLFEAGQATDDPANITAALARVQVARAPQDPPYSGKTLPEILRLRGTEVTVRNGAELLVDLVGRGAIGINHTIDDRPGGDVDRVMRHPLTSIASDGSVFEFGKDNPHPRSYGCFPRVLGHYVRDRKLITLEEAIRKMTSLPAARLGWTDRGEIEAGAWADLVVFDPKTIADRATFLDPHQHSIGVDHVLVNGRIVLEDGKLTGVLPGRPITRAKP